MEKFLVKKRKHQENEDDDSQKLNNNKVDNVSTTDSTGMTSSDGHVSHVSHVEQSSSYILDGQFFTIVKKEDKKISARCEYCPKIICGSSGSTGNFLSHISRIHPNLIPKLQERKGSSKHSGTVPTNDKGQKNFQTKLTHNCISKNKVANLVFNYITSEMRPLSTVEKPSFIKLVRGLSNNENCPIPTRASLTTELHKKYELYKSNLTKIVRNQRYLCTTADIWSSNNRSYLGMTCHYITETEGSLERKSAILACRRITDSHTYHRIATVMNQVHKDFNIDILKITACVTDNATNFGKAFRVFHGNHNEIQEVSNNNDTNTIDNTNDDDDDDSAEIEIVDITPVFNLSNYVLDDDDDAISLPVHVTCFSHTLNLVATTDANKAVDKNADYKKMYRSAMGKVQAFWNLLSRSTVAADAAYEMCGCRFPTPVVTRWNSTYDALKKILAQKDKLNELLLKLKLVKIKQTEFVFLEEYCDVMGPVAIALDKLQGELTCFLGYVAPTIIALRQNLIKITYLTYCNTLQLTLIQSLERRFDYLLDLQNPKSKPFILASMSLPKFKDSWIPTRFSDLCHNLFFNESTRIATTITNSDAVDTESVSSTSSEGDDNFYSVLQNKNKNLERDNEGNVEASSYLKSKARDLNSLKSYRVIKEMFLKYNTTLPSSAPVERLFSSGAQILTPRRNRLSDKHFEMLLICRNLEKL